MKIRPLKNPESFYGSTARSVRMGICMIGLAVPGLSFSETKSTLRQETSSCSKEIAKEEKAQVVLTSTAVGVGAVTVWGVLNWDYFSQSPNRGSEGWFGEDAKHGGVDKLGHMYASYVFSHGLAAFYEHKNFSRYEAGLYGSLTSWAVMSYVEFGDSFSNFGFSDEDLVMNSAGCLVAYLLYTQPKLARKIDFRVQYGVQPSQVDFATDYENMKFLVALKLNGFEALEKTLLKHVEFHYGYYAEGFEDDDKKKERYTYLGVGINLTDLFRRRGYTKTATVLNYVQVPYTSINYDSEL